jgi:hypothetical protein
MIRFSCPAFHIFTGNTQCQHSTSVISSCARHLYQFCIDCRGRQPTTRSTARTRSRTAGGWRPATPPAAHSPTLWSEGALLSQSTAPRPLLSPWTGSTVLHMEAAWPPSQQHRPYPAHVSQPTLVTGRRPVTAVLPRMTDARGSPAAPRAAVRAHAARALLAPTRLRGLSHAGRARAWAGRGHGTGRRRRRDFFSGDFLLFLACAFSFFHFLDLSFTSLLVLSLSLSLSSLPFLTFSSLLFLSLFGQSGDGREANAPRAGGRAGGRGRRGVGGGAARASYTRP